jgi:hypothetical protein
VVILLSGRASAIRTTAAVCPIPSSEQPVAADIVAVDPCTPSVQPHRVQKKLGVTAVYQCCCWRVKGSTVPGGWPEELGSNGYSTVEIRIVCTK